MVRIEISEIEQDGRIIVVRVRQTGQRLRLPEREVGFLPGAVTVPEWLAKKMFHRTERVE